MTNDELTLKKIKILHPNNIQFNTGDGGDSPENQGLQSAVTDGKL